MVLQPEECLERGQTLTERLERGPLSLSLAIRHAYDIAKALRELHKKGKAHGALTGRAIEIRSSGAFLLLSPGGLRPEIEAQKDIHGFGWVLRSLFPDDDPPPSPPGSAPADPASPGTPSRNSSEGVWMAARKLTARCLADPADPDWTMQKVVSELRLLDLVARQWEKKAQLLPESRSPETSIWRPRANQLDRVAPPATLEPPEPAEPPPPAAAPAPSAMDFALNRPEPKISNVRCPQCRTLHVHPSTPKSDFEETLELWNMPVLRCHRCSYRYFRFMGIAISKGA